MPSFRLPVLVAIAIAAVPATSASARRIPECHLLSTSDLAHATGYRGVREKGNVIDAPAMTGAKGSLALCQYASGADSLGQASVMTLRTASAARAELGAEVRADAAARRMKARRLSGPWRQAYTVGRDELYLVKGRRMLYLQIVVKVRPGVLRGLAVKAARRL